MLLPGTNLETVRKEQTMEQPKQKKLSQDDVEIIANHLYAAMLALPAHHHSKKLPSECGNCQARVSINRAYRMLPPTVDAR